MDALDYRPHPSVRLPGNRASLMPKLQDHNDNPATAAQAAILGGVLEHCRQVRAGQTSCSRILAYRQWGADSALASALLYAVVISAFGIVEPAKACCDAE